MPIYSNALAQRPANMLAYQDTLSATPRNEYLGALADLIAQSYAPDRTQQMQGVAKFLSAPAISQTLDRLSYGEPLTTGAGGLGGTTRVRPEALEAAMAVAPAAKPVTMASLQAARAARQAALATGRAGERYAERVVPEILNRGGLPAEMLQGMANKTISPMDVFHGSPHGPFTKFEASKIGTGEGAQVYGMGHYTAEARGTGQRYKDVLSGRIIGEDLRNNPDMPSRIAGHYVDLYKTPNLAAKALQYGLDTNPSLTKQARETTLAAIDLLKSKENTAGYLYKIDLPDEAINKMLDWENAVPENLRQQISKVAMDKFGSGSTGTSGELLYKELSREFKNAGSKTPDRDASEFLRNQGVTGIRYLDQESRAAGQGTSNFVVFPGNEDLLKIIEINDKPVNALTRR